MINVVGKIEQKGFGFGTWALVTEDGQTYELKDAPDELRKPEIKVKVKGTVREDVMSTAMIGPILEVESFEITDQ
ncbi:MAG: hypothetical protein WA865_05385 [Spirulinaceae cyanobacterium]